MKVLHFAGGALLLALAVIGLTNLLILVDAKVKSKSSFHPRALRTMSGSIGDRYLETLKLYLTRYDSGEDTAVREEGRDWPATAETMIGLKRLDNLQFCIRDVIVRKVPGDLIECGAWRGGATIFMRAVLDVYDDKSRCVWVADSFEGLPKPDASRYPADTGSQYWTFTQLAVSLEEVRANFQRYGLLDNRVRFLKGWFKDTLPVAPIKDLAVLRIDADMYEGTIEALGSLYAKVSPGGYVIIDDYGSVSACRRAVEDFRARNHISSIFKWIDRSGVYWQR